jgi:negative regulator of flagellin synthesis FlgM
MSYANNIGTAQQAITNAPSATTQAPQVSSASDGTKENTVSNPNQGTDQATLSASASLVAKALEGSDVRSAKVSSLQQTIATGNYNVSSSAVADKMIRSLLE